MRKQKILRKRLAELEAELKKLYTHKLALIDILVELNRRLELSPDKNELAYAKQIKEEIFYVDGWIRAYLKSIEDCKNKLNELQLEKRTFAKAIKKPLVYIIPFIVLSLIVASLFLFKPLITGYAVFTKETTYNQSLDLELNESGNYALTLNKTGDIKSIRATGSVIGNGTVKIYIEKDGKRHLIYKNKQ